MSIPLAVNSSYDANPGDEFRFTPNPGWFGTQYRIQVDGVPVMGLVIGVWQSNGSGKARNKVGQNFVERTLPKDNYKITVEGASGPYKITIGENSWWHKVFGR